MTLYPLPRCFACFNEVENWFPSPVPRSGYIVCLPCRDNWEKYVRRRFFRDKTADEEIFVVWAKTQRELSAAWNTKQLRDHYQ